MRVLIVYAHPEPTSFSGAMKDLAVETLTAAGHAVTVSDLYAQGFNPVAGPHDFIHRVDPARLDIGTEQANAARTAGFAPDIQAEIDKLMAADFLILQFPFWWYSVPAMLKGWIDRVFAYGVAYDFGRTWDRGVFRGRRAMLAFTTSAPPTSSLPDGRNGDLERTLWPLHAGVLALCGYDVLQALCRACGPLGRPGQPREHPRRVPRAPAPYRERPAPVLSEARGLWPRRPTQGGHRTPHARAASRPPLSPGLTTGSADRTMARGDLGFVV